MSGKRSPNCPAHSLGESIDKAKSIYEAEGRNGFSGSRAVIHMGYNGLNGASRRALGAVRAFGLLEGRGAELRISDDAVLIIADADVDDQSERQEALRRCLRHNRVFADLLQRFRHGGVAQEISGYLQKKYRFKPTAADHTAQVFQRSVALLTARGQVRLEPQGGDGIQPPAAATSEKNREVPAVGTAQQQLPSPGDPVPAGSGDSRPMPYINQDAEPTPATSRKDCFVLENGTAQLSWPATMSREEFEDFTDWLVLEHRKISRGVEGGGELRIRRGNGTPGETGQN